MQNATLLYTGLALLAVCVNCALIWLTRSESFAAHALRWRFSKLPRDAEERDRVLIQRAAKVLDMHPDPAEGTTLLGRHRAELLLRDHTLARHALFAIVRERDPRCIAQAKKAERELAEGKPLERVTRKALHGVS